MSDSSAGIAKAVRVDRTGYQLHFEEIAAGQSRLGLAAPVPWDSDIFGFPVAIYRPEASELDDSEKHVFLRHFHSWMEARNVALCSCSIPSESLLWRKTLQQAGFHFVDITLRPSLAGLAAAHIPDSRFPVRSAEAKDRPAIKAIAEDSFAHGRYHADPFFPKYLADRRYRVWIENALDNPNPEDRIFVLEQSGEVKGFFHTTLENSLSDLRLAAVAPDVRATLIGVDLYASTLHALRRLGVRRVVTSVSATNTAVINLYAMLGFRFGNPEMVYHWHSKSFPERI
jgi:ribosomal protein S18 acetylase RimI-like enzyme